MDTSHHQPEARALGVRRREPKGRVALEHGLALGAWPHDLEEMVHDPYRVEARLVGGMYDPGQRGADLGTSARPRERENLKPYLHDGTPITRLHSLEADDIARRACR